MFTLSLWARILTTSCLSPPIEDTPFRLQTIFPLRSSPPVGLGYPRESLNKNPPPVSLPSRISRGFLRRSLLDRSFHGLGSSPRARPRQDSVLSHCLGLGRIGLYAPAGRSRLCRGPGPTSRARSPTSTSFARTSSG